MSDFPDFPLLTRDRLDPLTVVAEYLRLCEEYGYPVGVSFRMLLDHDYRQGAQLHRLGFTQRVEQRGRAMFAYLTRTVA